MAEPALPAVEFLSQVRDATAAAAAWLRGPQAQGRRVRVTGEPSQLQRLSLLLWTQDREGFLPHWSTPPAGSPAPTEPGIARTPIWLGDGPVAGAEPDCLLNLGPGMPAEPARLARIVEIVTTDDEGRQAGRTRWAAYRAMGITPAHRNADATD